MPIIDDPGLISFSKREKASHTAHTPQASNLKGENKYARQAENPTSHAKPTACMPCTPELSLHTSSKRVYFSDSVRENYLRNNRSGVKPVEKGKSRPAARTRRSHACVEGHAACVHADPCPSIVFSPKKINIVAFLLSQLFSRQKENLNH